MFADTPQEEIKERDKRSIGLLEEAKKRVLVAAPSRVWLGPFSLGLAEQAFQKGRLGTLNILDSQDESLLGHPDLQ